MSEHAAFGNEVNATTTSSALPPYAEMLAAFQHAHSTELRALIGELPISSGDRILDMACGNGTYSAWLAERAGATGMVIGVDINAGYLVQARERLLATRWPERSAFPLGDIAALPFAANSFDMIWCAYSLYSLPSLIGSLHELRRVLRPGGTLAVLENDMLHHVIIPWPGKLELAVRRAQLAALEADNNTTGKYFIGRQFRGAFAAAGLRACHVKPYAITRYAPLGNAERSYLLWYFQDLAARASSHLDAATAASFELLFSPDSELFLLDRPDFYVIYIDLLALARK